MGSSGLPPFGWARAFTLWQFAPVVTAVTVLFAGLYLWGVVRVWRRHPARPWPVPRTAAFFGGLLVVVLATESGVGTYDETLFWVHMIQHLMLIMIAPPLLVFGQPVTLLMHASRNPLHTWVKRTVRSWPAAWLTWPAFGVMAYAATIVGTHLTSFMNLVVAYPAVHDAEHVLYLVVGYLYFLPLIGREPIRWKVSYPLRLFLLFIAMPVDAFTGVVLNSYGTDPFKPLKPRTWGPSALEDVHLGGAVMWIGGAGIMFVLIMVTFFAWSRETRPSGGMGWLESARRATMAERLSEGIVPAAGQAGQAQEQGQAGQAQEQASRAGAGAGAGRAAGNRGNRGNRGRGGKAGMGGRSIDDDEHLAAYNAYLARLAAPGSPDTADQATADPDTADPDTADPDTADPDTAAQATADPDTADPATAAQATAARPGA